MSLHSDGQSPNLVLGAGGAVIVNFQRANLAAFVYIVSPRTIRNKNSSDQQPPRTLTNPLAFFLFDSCSS